MKLARPVSNQNGVSRRLANQLLAAGRVWVDGAVCRDGSEDISRFREVKIDKDIIQQAEPAYYLMLHKPARSEEHTSELQSRPHLVCRPLPEKKNHRFAT